MEKFLNIPVYGLISGLGNLTSTAPSGGANLVVSGQSFLTDVSDGDIVHNATDNEYSSVFNVASDTQLDLTALSDGAPADITSGKSVYIHSGSVNNGQLVSVVGISLIEQTTASTCDIHYDTATASDMITITHIPVPTGSEAVRDMIQDAVVISLDTIWTDVSLDIDTLPYKAIAINLY